VRPAARSGAAPGHVWTRDLPEKEFQHRSTHVTLTHMKKALTKVGNSYGIILSKEVLGMLGIDPKEGVELYPLGTVLGISKVGLHPSFLEAASTLLKAEAEEAAKK